VTDHFVEKDACITTPSGMPNMTFITNVISFINIYRMFLSDTPSSAINIHDFKTQNKVQIHIDLCDIITRSIYQRN
jgi:hypothetical protein